jgi:hypothetical protein
MQHLPRDDRRLFGFGRLLETRAAGANAVIAVETMGPTPGIVINRHAVGSVFERRLILASNTAVCASKPVVDQTQGESQMAALGVRREKAALSSGCEAHPATIAPAGSNRSRHGGDEMSEASG